MEVDSKFARDGGGVGRVTKVLDGKYSVRYAIGGVAHNLAVGALTPATANDADKRNNSQVTTRSGAAATSS